MLCGGRRTADYVVYTLIGEGNHFGNLGLPTQSLHFQFCLVMFCFVSIQPTHMSNLSKHSKQKQK